MGRPPKLTPHQKHKGIKRRDTGNETLADIGRSYNVSGDDFTARGVIYALCRRQRNVKPILDGWPDISLSLL